MLRRLFTEKLLAPEDVAPSDARLSVAGTFNPGGVDLPGGPVLLVRVAEEAPEGDLVGFPRYSPDGELIIDQFPRSAMLGNDKRCVGIAGERGLRLGFVSHFRAYRLLEDRTLGPEIGRFMPDGTYETYGVEDPRVVFMDGRCWITYVGVSPHGVVTRLASTTDFVTYERHGTILPCENKDVLLFPEKVGGRYACLHRPNPNMHFSPPEMWYATSPDLVDWGGHRVLQVGGSDWQADRVGGGAPPIAWEGGWLELYHASAAPKPGEALGTYSGGALLLDRDEPWKVLAQSREPILVPTEAFEKGGYVNDVVFPTATFDRGDSLWVAYGGADRCVGLTALNKTDIAASLSKM